MLAVDKPPQQHNAAEAHLVLIRRIKTGHGESKGSVLILCEAFQLPDRAVAHCPVVYLGDKVGKQREPLVERAFRPADDHAPQQPYLIDIAAARQGKKAPPIAPRYPLRQLSDGGHAQTDRCFVQPGN